MSIQVIHGQNPLAAGQAAMASASEESHEGGAEKAREASQPAALPGQLAPYQGRNIDLNA